MENRQAIAALCERFQVMRLEIFGSAATGDFDEGASDLDFLVEFKQDPSLSLADLYFGLLETLTELLGCRVDLVVSRSLRNPYLIKAVEQSRQTLYAA